MVRKMLSDKITKLISDELNLDADKQEIINYGVFAVVQVMISLALIISLGVIFGLLPEVLIVSFSINILRQYSGGTHASTPSLCIIIGTAATFLLAYTAHWISFFANIYGVLLFGFLVFSWAYYIVYKRAPVDSSKKPITLERKRVKMRKLSFLILSIYFLITLVLNYLAFNLGSVQFISFSLCLYAGVIWQIITLTITGYKILSKIDNFLSTIFLRKEIYSDEN